MSEYLKDKVIVITGASSGFGAETALMAARRGAKVVLAARSGAALQEIAQEIIAGGGEALVVATDVTQRSDLERLARLLAAVLLAQFITGLANVFLDWPLVAALVLRIIFALMVTWLLGIVGLVLAGGLLLRRLSVTGPADATVAASGDVASASYSLVRAWVTVS